MAMTSNTIQFGAEFKASIKAGNWKIEGTIGGDALIRMPFSFDVTIKGGVHVKYRGHNLIGVDFKGGLAGPSPLVLRGEVCVSLLLFDACWSDSFTARRLGRRSPARVHREPRAGARRRAGARLEPHRRRRTTTGSCC